MKNRSEQMMIAGLSGKSSGYKSVLVTASVSETLSLYSREQHGRVVSTAVRRRLSTRTARPGLSFGEVSHPPVMGTGVRELTRWL